MNRKILGIDLGSNSLGWALLEEQDGEICSIIDLGSRIFTKAVEEKTPTPKNVTRRSKRLGRRVIQRRARRKQRMLNYLVSLDLLPNALQGHTEPEILLNEIGDPYQLRAKALDFKLGPYELGRILLHFVARRGFLSSKKQLAGDLVDDPDTIVYLNTLDDKPTKDKEESAYKEDIKKIRLAIIDSNARTLGEYLFKLEQGRCKRNRGHDAIHLRTDRKMYRDELEQIWQHQSQYFSQLPDDFMEEKEGVKQIIFYQRPLKLKKERIGKCSLEDKNYRAAMARLECQRFRYLQKINDLKYFDVWKEKLVDLRDDQKQKLIPIFEQNPKISITKIKKELGFERKLNFEVKGEVETSFKGNITACEIRSVLTDDWDNFTDDQQRALVEDLLTIKKKSVLKTRLIRHWRFSKILAIQLCLLEFEPGHSNLSLKAINKILPGLKGWLNYANARKAAGYGYEKISYISQDKLGNPKQTANPIVNKGLHELKRVVNAIIKEYGKPDAIRIEMARDLEMNTKRYREHQARQAKNRKANEVAVEKYKGEKKGKYPSAYDKIKYRLWEEQNHCCAYSLAKIPIHELFTDIVVIDHILPYKKSLDNSYMNKALCYEEENDNKGDRTPKDAWDGNEEKWNKITQAISRWKGLDSKVKRFYMTEEELQQRDFISTQLNDTRYISKLALDYVKKLGFENTDRDVTPTKGAATAWLRYQWGLNNLLNDGVSKKDRSDHRHHAIDATVIACVNKSLYDKIYTWTKNDEKKLKVSSPYPDFRKELDDKLKHIIIAHCPLRKLSGALHEETGAGYIEKHGGLVYRKNLAPDFTLKNASKIVDQTIKAMVLAHLANYDNNPKKAFAEGIIVLHKDGKTPIKRVRVLQSKTSLSRLEQSKFGVKDRSGKIFKWMSYGNMHHVEIIQHKQTGKYHGQFITMMEAHRRAMTGTQSAQKREVIREQIIKQNHGDEYLYIMALHINDLVSVAGKEGARLFYRVQKLDSGSNRFVLREHRASTLNNKQDELYVSISREKFEQYDLKLHKINAIGIIIHD